MSEQKKKRSYGRTWTYDVRRKGERFKGSMLSFSVIWDDINSALY